MLPQKCPSVQNLRIDPGHFAKWWGPRGATCTRCDIDLRVGGAWRTDILGESGETHVLRGEYREIEKPHRLVFTWTFGRPEDGPRPITEVTLEFGARGRGSELRVFHRDLPPDMADSHERGWLGCFTCLDDYAAEKGL